MTKVFTDEYFLPTKFLPKRYRLYLLTLAFYERNNYIHWTELILQNYLYNFFFSKFPQKGTNFGDAIFFIFAFLRPYPKLEKVKNGTLLGVKATALQYAAFIKGTKNQLLKRKWLTK